MPDLVAARSQMALSLGWHIVLACYGVGFPLIVLLAEWRALRTGDAAYSALARAWTKALGVLFAIGAVSGTILSFELGILWPRFMGRFGEVVGLPFAMEGIAFFVEAIFVGLYLYGWDRLSPRVHLLSGVPIVVAGLASAWFVVTANAWMNQPTGFRPSASRSSSPPSRGCGRPSGAPRSPSGASTSTGASTSGCGCRRPCRSWPTTIPGRWSTASTRSPPTTARRSASSGTPSR